MTYNQKIILGVLSLRKGEEYAIQSPGITALTGIGSRSIRSAVERLRLLGYPICSGSLGYWMAEKREDHKLGTRHLFTRGIKLLKEYQTQEKIPALELMGQLKLELEG